MSFSSMGRKLTIDSVASASGGVRTLFGEQVRPRIAAESTGGLVSVLDYVAPADFGPPRHVHHREDEMLDVISGRCVVWTPAHSSVLEPGDIVFFPRDEPHAWRAFGDEPVHFTVTVTPGGLERLFADMGEKGLDPNDLEALAAIVARAQGEILGPPLSDDEVRQIRAECDAA